MYRVPLQQCKHAAIDIDIELLDLIWAYYLWTGTAQKLPPLNFPNPKKNNGFVSDSVQIFQPNNAKQLLKHRHTLWSAHIEPK